MKNSTRQTITFLIIVLFLAACTPAATSPVDNGQEEQAPTLTLSPTETVLPTETLTPTATPIPPTPTFPAPEGADLPDSAVRSVNEQGQEVILDEPGGDVLWTLVESETGGLEWQPALSEMELLLQEKLNAHLEQQTSESAVILADYLTERIQGDKAWFEFEDRTYGWHPGERRWVQVTDENEDEIDWSLDTEFGDVIAPSWMTEDGKFAYINDKGEEVIVENQVFPYIGEVSLPELILMGQKRELVYDDQQGLSLKEYFDLLVLNCDDPDKIDLVDRMVGWAEEGFVMAGVLDRGYKKGWETVHRSYNVSKPAEKILGGVQVASDVLLPMVVEDDDGQPRVVAAVRVLQEVPQSVYLQQLEISNDGLDVRYAGTLDQQNKEVFGSNEDEGQHPLALALHMSSIEEQLDFAKEDPLLGPGFADWGVFRAVVDGDLSPEETVALLESEKPRIIGSRTNLLIVNR